jgi:hypothetical protein
MTITLHCLDCGFRISLTVPAREPPEAFAATLSCGQCGCRRWSEG